MEKIADFFTIYQRSAWDRDIEKMISLYDDEVLVFDMWERGYQLGLAAWSEVIRQWLGSLGEEKVKVAFEMIDIHERDDIAFASALIVFQAVVDSKVTKSMKNRVTLGFSKRGGQWRVVHQHTSAPVNFNMQAILSI